ncbi:MULTISPECIES: hypothetical protein [Clostridium]|jgi:hypothetical protein|uniref:Uncharacterized protein n=4 Tax=Clostridium TaxID=1485 RepID=A0A1S9N276_CLOBE|nr:MULTISPECIES: hypothetical protein [Clostridium]ALB45406.1 hypothetical protein X276_09005 [Clostridium beijerinckii NRRL B-598]AVK47460.1 hypothetical protein AXY43_05170 [Clostridium sp. MF28]MBC2459621.1 hypothetical protein [Clostridium beijerinckii]MBC2477106.1 hypothetical protein [Clostridium beijerinckii]MCI1580188.1 hypothetical protein [Clostridium beijerinckii]
MEIKLNEIEMLTILQALEVLHDQATEYKDLIYEDNKDFLVDINKTRMVHNKLLVQAKNEGIIKKKVSLI